MKIAARSERPPGDPVMKPCVFIHTNHKQYLGALGVDALHAAQLAPCRRVRRQADRVRELPGLLFQVRRPNLQPRRRQPRLGQGGPAVLHAAALHAARADELRGPCRRGRPGRVRGPGRVGAALPRHAGQGHHVPAAGHPAALRFERDAAGLRQAQALEAGDGLRRAVHRQARIQEMDEPGLRGTGVDRPDRGRVERLRQAHARARR